MIRRIACLASAGAGCIALAACGSSGTATKTVTATKTAAAPKQLTMAQVCASHPKDIGTIAGALTAFKVAMESGNTSELSPLSLDLNTAVEDIKTAATGATSSNLTAQRQFLQYLDGLEGAFEHPPKYPTAVIGDRDIKVTEQAGKAVGCPL